MAYTGKLEMYSCTQAAFNALPTKKEGAFYWIVDTKEVFIGSDAYAKGVKFVEALPTTGIAQGVVYFNTTTNVCSVHNGTSWKNIVPEALTTLTDTTDATKLVTAGAIRDFVASKISTIVPGSDISASEIAAGITVVTGEEEETVILNGVITGASYDSANGAITLTQSNEGDPIVLNLPKENFLSAASYDGDTTTLTLTLVDDTVVDVNLAELIVSYTFTEGNGIAIDKTNASAPSFSVKVDPVAGNALTNSPSGLKVDISGKADTTYVDSLFVWKEVAQN